MLVWPRFVQALLFPTLLAVLGALVQSAAAAWAQPAGLEDQTYVSPTWGYAVRWHSSEWTVQEDASDASGDVLALIDQFGNWITVASRKGYGGDATVCLDAMVRDARTAPGAVNFAMALDQSGNPYEWRGPEQLYIVFQQRVPAADGAAREFVIYAECQTLVPGEAVLQRAYTGPLDQFERWYDDIAETIEAVVLPASAWTPAFEDGDLTAVWSGAAPLLGEDRFDGAFQLAPGGAPELFVDLVDEAGDTRLVVFENVSDVPQTVDPGNVTLTLYALTGEIAGQELSATAIAWEDESPPGAAGVRTLAPGERAMARIDFLPPDLSAVSCAMLPYLELGYRPSPERFVDVAAGALPAELSDCLGEPLPAEASGRPVLRSPLPAGVSRESLLAATDGLLDPLGRVPLVRVALAPGAALPPGTLVGPLAAVVESGTLEFVLGATSITVPQGELLTAEEDAALDLRNGSDVTGTVLVLARSSDDPWSDALADQTAPGIAVQHLFPQQDLINRSAPRRFAIDRITLAPGVTLNLADVTAAHAMAVVFLVESGSVVTIDPGNTTGEPTFVAAGGTAGVPADGLVQTADEPAVLLLVEIITDEPTP